MQGVTREAAASLARAGGGGAWPLTSSSRCFSSSATPYVPPVSCRRAHGITKKGLDRVLILQPFLQASVCLVPLTRCQVLPILHDKEQPVHGHTSSALSLRA